MAVQKIYMTDALPAAADLTGSLHLIAKITNNSGAAEVNVAGAGELPCGVITEEATAGNPATFQINGIAKVVAGGAINPGQLVAADANGKAVVAAAGEIALGVARSQVANADEIVSVLLTYPHNNTV